MQPVLIVGGRGAGKTIKCIRLAAEHDSQIVCAFYDEAKRVSTVASKLGLDIRSPITYGEFIHGEFRDFDVSSFVIDNVDGLIAYMARGSKVVGMSIYSELVYNPRCAAWEPPETPE